MNFFMNFTSYLYYVFKYIIYNAEKQYFCKKRAYSSGLFIIVFLVPFVIPHQMGEFFDFR